MTRQVVVACRMRHMAVWVGRLGVVLVWPLAVPRRAVPYCWASWPWETGGTLNVRVGPLAVVWRGRP